jgi:hypothetical protein
MRAWLYGQFTPHESADAYKLFVTRSVAMGWLADATSASSEGIWGMNDAALGRSADSTPTGPPDPVAWFQVELGVAHGAQFAPPVHPFMACIESVMTRAGALHDLDSVQLLLPRQPPLSELVEMQTLGRIAHAAGWFAEAGGLSTPVTVSVESGQSESISPAAARAFDLMSSLPQNVFECRAFSTVTDGGQRARLHGVPDALWGGPARQRIDFRGELIDWSFDGLGWLFGLVASSWRRAGAPSPMVMTVSRVTGSDPTTSVHGA